MRKESDNQVFGISNFARNLGGAIAPSFLVAHLARQRQFSRGGLATRLHRGNIFFDRYMAALRESAIRTGTSVAVT